MSNKYILPLNDPGAVIGIVGGKGASLARLVTAGLPVPVGFHITTDAYKQSVAENNLQAGIDKALESLNNSDHEALEQASRSITKLFSEATIPVEIATEIAQAYTALPGKTPAVAVRSSATAEDLPEASFAGQQETYLNICGTEAVLEATRNCWASLWTARAIAYRAHQNIPNEEAALAVVVQLLVAADAAGILFTANPLNGRRDQILINASWGLGEAVVGGLVTPDTITMDKTSQELIKRETAEKLVQTVQTRQGTKEVPVTEELRAAAVLDLGEATTLAQMGVQIENLYDMPMDVEWALTQGKFYILQARPITALPEPEPPTPSEWKLPPGAYAAMRNNIVELMADPLTPLFRTLGLSAVNASWNRLLFAFFGKPGIMPDNPIIAVNEYAYYNGSVKIGPILKVILDTRGILKRMFGGAVERWTVVGRPKYLEIVQGYVAREWYELPATEILKAVRQLTEAAVDAYGALVSGVIPAAWMSEAWFTFRYKFIKRKGDPKAPVFLMGFDSTPIRAEKALFDLAQWAQLHVSLAEYLTDTPTSDLITQLSRDQAPLGLEPDGWEEWSISFQDYLKEYGHMIYNLDFGNPVPADDPTPVLDTFKLFLRGEGTSPYERQQETVERREEAIQIQTARLKGRRLKSFRHDLSRAQMYAPLREDGLADVGLGYPILRKMLREIGSRFVQGGIIDSQDDIFWLVEAEVEQASARLDDGDTVNNLSKLISQRKAIWRSARRVAAPMMLPQIRIFGKDLIALKSGGGGRGKTDTLKGVAASPGTVTGRACVIRGPKDFSQMKAGDILVAPLTTPAWTPLFARAAAVVTDVGGPLSHGSIVAREYGIPAVLGTGSATKRIQNGQTITVDGNSGKVTLQ